jgi:hypothetical protein
VPQSTSRRRLLQAGLGASPVLLSIVSEPVRASQIVCRSASAFASISAAGAAGVSANTQQICNGKGPEDWSGTSIKSWPAGTFTGSGDAATAELFSHVFSPGVALGNNLTPTLKQLLDAKNSNVRNVVLARYFIAAYLNFKSNRTPATVVTDLQLQAMWPQVVAGSYSPGAGAKAWTDQDVINWLKQTMTSN